MQELTFDEIDMVSGGLQGKFFETIGEAIDNPWTTLGRLADGAVSIATRVATGEIQAPPTPNFGFH